MQVHGHRGARAVFPENSLEGFRYAIDLGVDAIEMDVVVSRDDVVVVSHDPFLKDGRFIRTLDAAETELPSLDQVLDLAPRGNFLFNIEAKVSEQTPDYFVDLIHARIEGHSLSARVIFQSFDFPILHAMRRLDSTITLAVLWEGAARSFIEIAREAGTKIVAPEYRLVTPAEVRGAHDAGLRVIPWTANRPEDWQRLMDAGVDGIITDDPAALLKYLSR